MKICVKVWYGKRTKTFNVTKYLQKQYSKIDMLSFDNFIRPIVCETQSIDMFWSAQYHHFIYAWYHNYFQPTAKWMIDYEDELNFEVFHEED